MNPQERFRIVEDLVERALAVPVDQRAAFLQSQDVEESILREAGNLLAHASAGGRFSASEERDRIEDQDLGAVPPYTLAGRLGEGGMGVVYRAHQTHPVSREVALKVMRPGMASRQLVARFENERQTLAMMDHPNIARVFDAGATSRGFPYLVMELVDGLPLTRYCEEKQVGLRERVELMIPICLAVQHAHQKGIIHRDIKPSNILVPVYDGKPVPKVIDFGIAKVLETTQAIALEQTRAGILLGTLDYASPEQADPGKKDVDTRADVYSLGAVLYELLTGRTPLRLSLEAEGYGRILQRIHEESPPAPSRWNPAVAQELDWITARALEKDRELRYRTADALVEDLRRYLDGNPVKAGPASVVYKMGKLASKYRWAIGAGAAVLLLLLGTVGWMGFALQQQKRANANASALREVVRKVLVERPRQLAEVAGRAGLRDQLIRDAEGALTALSQDSQNDPALRLELARAYASVGQAKGGYTNEGSVGDFETGIAYMAKAVELFGEAAGRNPANTALQAERFDAWTRLMFAQRYRGRHDAAMLAAEGILHALRDTPPAVRRQLESKLRGMVLREQGIIRFSQGRSAEAYGQMKEALEAFRSGNEDPKKKALRLVSHTQDTATVGWEAEGPGPAVFELLRANLAAAENCPGQLCGEIVTWTLVRLGAAESATGNPRAGLARVLEGYRRRERELREDPTNIVLRISFAWIRQVLCQLTGAYGGPGAWNRAASILTADPKSGLDLKSDEGFRLAISDQIILASLLNQGGRYTQAEDALKSIPAEDLAQSAHLRWALPYQRALALQGQNRRGEARTSWRAAWAAAMAMPGDGLTPANMRSRTLVEWGRSLLSSGSTVQERAEVAGLLEEYRHQAPAYPGPPETFLILPPKPAEMTTVMTALRRRL